MLAELERIAKRVGLKVSDLRRVLWVIYYEEPIKNNELVRRTGIPKSILRDVKRELRFLLKPPSQYVALTDEGRKCLGDYISSLDLTLPIDKNLWDIDLSKYSDLVVLLQSHENIRPVPNRNLDQFRATIETTIKRADFMLKMGDIEGQDILFMGDNDLTSIAVAWLGYANKLCVVDIDVRVLEFIRLLAKLRNFKIECVQCDLRKGIPKSLRKSFDVVFTDPPYTPEGISLFLSRSIEALKDINSGIIYLCYGYSSRSKERAIRIQQIITNLGLVIRTKINDFNSYYGAESIGSRSSLYVCETTPMTKPLIKGRFDGSIYTGHKKTTLSQV